MSYSAACWLPEETFPLCGATASILLVKAGQPQWPDTKHHPGVQTWLGGRWAPRCRWDPQCSSSTGLGGLSFIHHGADTFLLSAWGSHTHSGLLSSHTVPCGQTDNPAHSKHAAWLLARDEQHWEAYHHIDTVTIPRFPQMLKMK